MSWVLFNDGRGRPPRSPRRLLVWAVVVFAFCAGVLPFLIVGMVHAIGRAAFGDAAVFALFAVMLLSGAVAAAVQLVRFINDRRRP